MLREALRLSIRENGVRDLGDALGRVRRVEDVYKAAFVVPSIVEDRIRIRSLTTHNNHKSILSTTSHSSLVSPTQPPISKTEMGSFKRFVPAFLRSSREPQAPTPARKRLVKRSFSHQEKANATEQHGSEVSQKGEKPRRESRYRGLTYERPAEFLMLAII
jgi:hypothetical protein